MGEKRPGERRGIIHTDFSTSLSVDWVLLCGSVTPIFAGVSETDFWAGGKDISVLGSWVQTASCLGWGGSWGWVGSEVVRWSDEQLYARQRRRHIASDCSPSHPNKTHIPYPCQYPHP